MILTLINETISNNGANFKQNPFFTYVRVISHYSLPYPLWPGDSSITINIIGSLGIAYAYEAGWK